MFITFDPTILLLKLFPKVIIERFRKNFAQSCSEKHYLEQQKIEKKRANYFSLMIKLFNHQRSMIQYILV